MENTIYTVVYLDGYENDLFCLGKYKTLEEAQQCMIKTISYDISFLLDYFNTTEKKDIETEINNSIEVDEYYIVFNNGDYDITIKIF